MTATPLSQARAGLSGPAAYGFECVEQVLGASQSPMQMAMKVRTMALLGCAW
jgi:hypothetical protein